MVLLRARKQESPTKKEPNRKKNSWHSLETGKLLTQNATPKDCKFKSYGTSRVTAVKTVARVCSFVSRHARFHTSHEVL
jgi:hypothetical protein